MEKWKVWKREDEKVKKSMIEGGDAEIAMSAYGRNDFVIDFLMQSELWGIMSGMYPDRLKQANGKDWQAMNGVEIIRELANVHRISKCNKIIRDVRLMIDAGFNVEEIKNREKKDKGVVDTETISNHLNRISEESCNNTFYSHVKHIRSQRWIRGHTYAADAHEITIPYGRKFEGLGKVGKKYGYKLVILLNIEEKRERIIGFQIAPLQKSERKMLLEIIGEIEDKVTSIEDMIDILILDRGYWGAKFIKTLKQKYKIDVVTRVRDEAMNVVKEDIDLWLKEPDIKWRWRREERSRLGKIKVKYTYFEDLELVDKRGKLETKINTVVAYEYYLSGKPVLNKEGKPRRMIYMTTLPVKRNPYKVRKYYLARWIIENQGFRELTQRWEIDILAGRKLNIIRSRIAFVLMLYTAMKLLDMKHPGRWQKEAKKLKSRGEKGWMGGLGIIAYTNDGYYGAFSVKEYQSTIKSTIKEEIRKRVEKGLTIEEILKEFDDL